MDGAKGRKATPYLRRCGRPADFALAGLWERWRDPQSGEVVLSCTLIVTEPTKWMLPYHDRMPVLLQQAEIDRWLSGNMSADELHPASELACANGRSIGASIRQVQAMTIRRCWSR